jgi:hypothetical protein
MPPPLHDPFCCDLLIMTARRGISSRQCVDNRTRTPNDRRHESWRGAASPDEPRGRGGCAGGQLSRRLHRVRCTRMRDRRPAVPAACGDVFPHVAEALSLAPGNGAAVRHTQPHTRLKGAGCGSHLPALDRGPVSRAVGAPAPIGCGVPIGAVKCPLPCPKLPRLRFLPCSSATGAARPARMRRSRARAAPRRLGRADGRNIAVTT